MKLIIFINSTMEDEQALVNLEDNEILLKGDFYHDKIEAQIQGFLKGLKFAEVDFIIEEEIINPDNDMFEKLEFYNDNF